MAFWIPWGVDVAAALVFVYFFFVGLGDGSVGADNVMLWLLILAICAVVVGCSLALLCDVTVCDGSRRAPGRSLRADRPLHAGDRLILAVALTCTTRSKR